VILSRMVPSGRAPGLRKPAATHSSPPITRALHEKVPYQTVVQSHSTSATRRARGQQRQAFVERVKVTHARSVELHGIRRFTFGPRDMAEDTRFGQPRCGGRASV
jgi:hypothetical protein